MGNELLRFVFSTSYYIKAWRKSDPLHGGGHCRSTSFSHLVREEASGSFNACKGDSRVSSVLLKLAQLVEMGILSY